MPDNKHISKHINHPLVLEAETIRLEPLQEEHIAPLLDIALENPELYQYTSTPLNDEQVKSYYAKAFRDREKELAYPFAMIDKI